MSLNQVIDSESLLETKLEDDVFALRDGVNDKDKILWKDSIENVDRLSLKSGTIMRPFVLVSWGRGWWPRWLSQFSI